MYLKKLLTRAIAVCLTLNMVIPKSFAMFPCSAKPADLGYASPIVLQPIQDYLRNITPDKYSQIVMNFIRSYEYWKTNDSHKISSAGNADYVREFINNLGENLNNEDFYVTLCTAMSSGYNAGDLICRRGIGVREIRSFSEKVNRIISTVPKFQRAFVPHIMLENSRRVFNENRDRLIAVFYLHASILFIFLNNYLEHYIRNYGF